MNTATELGGRDDASTELVRRMFERTEGAFKAAVERGQRTGEFTPDRDPAAVASLLLAALVGMRVIARAQGGRERLCRVADAALAML